VLVCIRPSARLSARLSRQFIPELCLLLPKPYLAARDADPPSDRLRGRRPCDLSMVTGPPGGCRATAPPLRNASCLWMWRRKQGGRHAKRGKTCRSCKAGTAPISTAKSQIGTVPYIVLVHECGGSIPPIVDFVHVGPSRITRLRDFSCVVGAALRC
jgi:hypothetical protein